MVSRVFACRWSKMKKTNECSDYAIIDLQKWKTTDLIQQQFVIDIPWHSRWKTRFPYSFTSKPTNAILCTSPLVQVGFWRLVGGGGGAGRHQKSRAGPRGPRQWAMHPRQRRRGEIWTDISRLLGQFDNNLIKKNGGGHWAMGPWGVALVIIHIKWSFPELRGTPIAGWFLIIFVWDFPLKSTIQLVGGIPYRKPPSGGWIDFRLSEIIRGWCSLQFFFFFLYHQKSFK